LAAAPTHIWVAYQICDLTLELHNKESTGADASEPGLMTLPDLVSYPRDNKSRLSRPCSD